MHLKTRQLALLGVILALTVLCVILGAVVETSTLFFLLLGAFLSGVVFHDGNVGLGWAFYLAAILLSLILSPNKLYCVTFGVMALYFAITETISILLKKYEKKTKHLKIIKLVVFNLIYLPIMFWFPALLFTRQLTAGTFIVFFIAGQAAFFVVDYAYLYFVEKYWNRIKKSIFR